MSLSFCYSMVKTSFNLPFSLLYNWRKQGILHSTKPCTHVPCSVDMIIGITLISFAQGYAKLTYLTFAAHWVQVWVVTKPQCLPENFLWHINLPRVWDLSPSTASQNGWGWQGPLGPSAALLQQGHPEQGAQGHVQAALEDLQGGDPTASRQTVPMLHHSISWCSEGTPCAPVCAHCLFVLALSRAWLRPLCTLPSVFYGHWWDPPEPPLGWALPALSASPHRRDAPDPASSCCPSVVLSPASPCFSGTGGDLKWTQHTRCGLSSAE